MADVDRRLHFLLALDEDGLDVAPLRADGDGDLIAADGGVASGMLGEEREEAVAFQNAVGDDASPVVAVCDAAFFA